MRKLAVLRDGMFVILCVEQYNSTPLGLRFAVNLSVIRRTLTLPEFARLCLRKSF